MSRRYFTSISRPDIRVGVASISQRKARARGCRRLGFLKFIPLPLSATLGRSVRGIPLFGVSRVAPDSPQTGGRLGWNRVAWGSRGGVCVCVCRGDVHGATVLRVVVAAGGRVESLKDKLVAPESVDG